MYSGFDSFTMAKWSITKMNELTHTNFLKWGDLSDASENEICSYTMKILREWTIGITAVDEHLLRIPNANVSANGTNILRVCVCVFSLFLFIWFLMRIYLIQWIRVPIKLSPFIHNHTIHVSASFWFPLFMRSSFYVLTNQKPWLTFQLTMPANKILSNSFTIHTHTHIFWLT